MSTTPPNSAIKATAIQSPIPVSPVLGVLGALGFFVVFMVETLVVLLFVVVEEVEESFVSDVLTTEEPLVSEVVAIGGVVACVGEVAESRTFTATISDVILFDFSPDTLLFVFVMTQ